MYACPLEGRWKQQRTPCRRPRHTSVPTTPSVYATIPPHTAVCMSRRPRRCAARFDTFVAFIEELALAEMEVILLFFGKYVTTFFLGMITTLIKGALLVWRDQHTPRAGRDAAARRAANRGRRGRGRRGHRRRRRRRLVAASRVRVRTEHVRVRTEHVRVRTEHALWRDRSTRSSLVAAVHDAEVSVRVPRARGGHQGEDDARSVARPRLMPPPPSSSTAVTDRPVPTRPCVSTHHDA